MTSYIHDKCQGAVDMLEEGYGMCTECGDEGEIVTVEESLDDTVTVAIPFPTCNRLENF
jgi:hypothetical protein